MPFIQVATGKYHTCGLLTNGVVLCWGSITTANVPSSDYIKVVSGAFYLCGLTIHGQMLCWGSGAYTPPNKAFVNLYSGGQFMIRMLANQSLVVWGDSNNGE